MSEQPKTTIDAVLAAFLSRCREDWETAIDTLAEHDMPMTAEALRKIVEALANG